MRRHRFTRLFQILLLVLPLLAFSCEDTHRPVYLSWHDFRESFKVGKARKMITKGKIYATQSAIFVSEPNIGIHVIDNSDPAAPVKVCFLSIPGNLDCTGKDNCLYADSFTDLLVLDISDLHNITLIKRIKDVFPYNEFQAAPDDENFIYYGAVDEERGVIIGWIKE